MARRKLNKVWVYAIAIGLPLAVGAVSAIVSMKGMKAFPELAQPPLSPPGWLFSVVWSILYVLMGISSARVYLANTLDTRPALTVYLIQLVFNALWTPIFFELKLRLVAFVWLVILFVLAVYMTGRFKKVDRLAGNLQFPYLLWLLFAGYLNMGVFLLNR